MREGMGTGEVRRGGHWGCSCRHLLHALNPTATCLLGSGRLLERSLCRRPLFWPCQQQLQPTHPPTRANLHTSLHLRQATGSACRPFGASLQGLRRASPSLTFSPAPSRARRRQALPAAAAGGHADHSGHQEAADRCPENGGVQHAKAGGAVSERRPRPHPPSSLVLLRTATRQGAWQCTLRTARRRPHLCVHVFTLSAACASTVRAPFPCFLCLSVCLLRDPRACVTMRQCRNRPGGSADPTGPVNRDSQVRPSGPVLAACALEAVCVRSGRRKPEEEGGDRRWQARSDTPAGPSRRHHPTRGFLTGAALQTA